MSNVLFSGKVEGLTAFKVSQGGCVGGLFTLFYVILTVVAEAFGLCLNLFKIALIFKNIKLLLFVVSLFIMLFFMSVNSCQRYSLLSFRKPKIARKRN